MSTNLTESVRQVLEQTLITGWATEQPGVLLAFANTSYRVPTNSPWAQAQVLPGRLRRANLGREAELVHLGAVAVQCMVPEHQGTKPLRQLADSVAAVLMDRQIALPEGGHVTTYDVDIRDRGCINGWYSATVFISYRARVLLPR